MQLSEYTPTSGEIKKILNEFIKSNNAFHNWGKCSFVDNGWKYVGKTINNILGANCEDAMPRIRINDSFCLRCNVSDNELAVKD